MQSVTCLATDACLAADPGVASSILEKVSVQIPDRSHTFVEIDHKIISMAISLHSAVSMRVVTHEVLVNRLF